MLRAMSEASKIEIRAARPVDADQVYRLMIGVAEEEGVLVAAPDEITKDGIRTRIRNTTSRRNQMCYVAMDDERVVGMVILEASPYRALDHVRFMSLAVEPRYRRKGFAHALVRQAIQWAAGTGKVRKLQIDLRENNVTQIDMVKSLGFKEEGRLKHQIQMSNGREIDEIILTLFVEPAPEKE